MPNSTTMAEAVTALSGPGIGSGDAAGGAGNAEGGFQNPPPDSRPCWATESNDAKDGQSAEHTWVETAEPRLIPKIFPVYAFI